MPAKDANIPALDGLRGFACLVVLFAHAGDENWFFNLRDDRQFGVMLFFTLSGFLMAYHYMPGQFSWRYWLAFLTRRFFRVYPAFAVIVLITWIASSLHLLHIRLYNLLPFDWNKAVNHLLLQQGLGVFWTIPVEMKFYLLFPLLAIGLLWLRPSPSIASGIIIAAWIGSLYLNMGKPHIRQDIHLWPYLSFFLGGMMAGSLLMQHSYAQRFRYWQTAAFLCMAIIFCCIVIRLHLVVVPKPFTIWWDYTWAFSPLMAITVLSVARCGGVMAWLFSNRAARFIGTISYSLYLVHYFVFNFVQPFPRSIMPGFFLIVILGIFAAWLLYVSIEKPFNNLGRKLSAKIMQ